MIAPQAPRTVAIAPPTACKSFVHHVSLTQYTTTSPHHSPSKIIPPIKITSSPSRCTTGDAPVILTDTRGRAWPSENGQRLKNPSMCARKARALFRMFLLATTFVVAAAAAPALQYSTAWEKKTWKDGTRQAYVHVKIGGALPGQGHCTKRQSAQHRMSFVNGLQPSGRYRTIVARHSLIGHLTDCFAGVAVTV